MAFRDLLLVLRSYPTPTPDETIERCVALAAAWGARLSAIACGIRPKGAGNPLRYVLVDIASTLAQQSNSSESDAEAMLATYGSAARRYGVEGAAILETCTLAEVPHALAGHARLRDLTILTVPGDDYLAGYDLNLFAETVLFDSGHPVLVLPTADVTAFDTVVIAWDGSQYAARAINDALPLLAAAKTVNILTVANKKTAGAVQSAPDLAEHLAAHGITAAVDSITSSGRKIDAVFADYVATHRADLIVMGGYGQSKLREFVLGGTTQSLLARPPTALFISH